MVNIYYGRESEDRSRFMFEKMSGRSVVLVPDQATLEIEKDAFSFLGVKGFIDIEILGFSRLFDRVLDECGRDRRTLIDKYGRHMLLADILEKNKDRLSIYRNHDRMPGFIEMVNNFLAQIRQNNITCDDLAAICESVDRNSLLYMKLTDLVIIYGEYESALSGKYIDSENFIDTVTERMKDCSWLKERVFWIYGFDTLTEKNCDVLRQLIAVCPQVNFVVTAGRGGRDDDLFSLTECLMRRISELAKEAGSDAVSEKITGYERKRSSALAHLERELYSMPYRTSQECEGITLVSAGSKYGEAESAAAYITGLVRDRGLRYSEIALICNSMEKDLPAISRVFSRYGIPLFVDAKKNIWENRIVTFVVSALGTVSEGYDNRHIFSMLKTGLTEFERNEIEELENYVLRYRIRGSSWRKEFTMGQDEYSPEEFASLEDTRRRLMEILSEFEEDFKKDRKTGKRVRALYRFMTDKMDIPGKIKKEVERLTENGYTDEAAHTSQIWNILADLLLQIDELTGENECRNGDLLKLLEAGIEQAQTGIIPQTADGVSVGTCQRSRLGRIRALVVMSADEGSLPMNSSSQELLNNDELEALAEKDISIVRLDRVRDSEEALGIYRTFSAPSEYLWIGTSLVDISGGAVKPSPLISTLRGIFPGLKAEPDIFNSGNPIDMISGPESTLEHLASALRDGAEGRPVDDVFCQAAGWFRENSRHSLDIIENGLFYSAKIDRADRKKVLPLYMKGRDTLKLSPSGLEKYGRCPFDFFISYGLSPKERRVFEMAGREIGDVYHHILMEMSKELTEEGVPLTGENSRWMTVTEEEFDSMMSRIIEAESEGYSQGLLSFSNEEKYRTQRLAKIVREAGWILISQMRRGRVKEAAFEERFGEGRKIPPVEVDTDAGRIYIEGIIDRIDVLPDESIKIIDYKTGNDTFSSAEAKAGWKLQLMIYLKAGLQYKNIERKPAGVFYFKIREAGRELTGSQEGGVSLKDYKLEGAVVNDPVAINSIAGDFTGYSDILYLRNGKDGIAGTSDDRLFEPDRFSELMRQVDEKIKELCDGIVSGEISPAPKKNGRDRTSCTYCRCRGICRFDTGFEDCRYEWI